MGRTPCCMKEGLNRGPWTPDEDLRLSNYVETHGEGGWRTLPKKAGLLRCGKSCRLRWMNYLRPDVKRGKILPEEEDLILRLHRLLGNRWSLIAGRIPGRTDNEIKNYWNTHLSKKLITKGIDPRTHKPLSESQDVSAVSGDCDTNPKSPREENIPQSSQVPQNTVRIGAAKRESVGFTEKDDGGSPCTQSSYYIPETFPLSVALNFSEGDVSCHNDKAVPPPALVKSGVMGTPFLFEETFTDNEVSLPPFITTTSISGLAGLGLGDYHHHNYLLNNSSYDTRSSYSRGAVPFLNNDASVPSNASLEKQLQASEDLQAFEMELENSDTLHHNKLSNTNWASPVFSFSAFDDCSSAMLSSLTQSFLNEELQLHHSETSPHLNSVLEPCPNRNDSGSLLWSLLSPTEHYYPCT